MSLMQVGRSAPLGMSPFPDSDVGATESRASTTAFRRFAAPRARRPLPRRLDQTLTVPDHARSERNRSPAGKHPCWSSTARTCDTNPPEIRHELGGDDIARDALPCTVDVRTNFYRRRSGPSDTVVRRLRLRVASVDRFVARRRRNRNSRRCGYRLEPGAASAKREQPAGEEAPKTEQRRVGTVAARERQRTIRARNRGRGCGRGRGWNRAALVHHRRR